MRRDRSWPRILHGTTDCPPEKCRGGGGNRNRQHPQTQWSSPPMGEIVNLRSTPIDLHSDIGHAFVVDATRAAEGLITDKELAEKYELSPADWQTICKDKSLGNMIRAERERRVRDGTAVREAAAKH